MMEVLFGYLCVLLGFLAALVLLFVTELPPPPVVLTLTTLAALGFGPCPSFAYVKTKVQKRE